MTEAGPLGGIRVLEVGGYLSGPFAGQMLADLGAEVIKVETPPAGDPFRSFGQLPGGTSPIFLNINRGKHSVSPDLKDPEQRRQLLELVTRCDVWLCNWRPGVAKRLGLDDAELVRTNPRLIRAYVTGYGPDGPSAPAPVFDTIVQAASGATQALSRTDEPKVVPGFPADKTTSMMATQAILAALYARERHGLGDRIDISMLSAVSYVNFVELFSRRMIISEAPADPRNRHVLALRPLRTKDGWITVAPVSGQSIRNVCNAVGHPEWRDEIRSVVDPSEIADALFSRLDSVLPEQETTYWLQVLHECDVPAARCLSMDEHLQDPQVVAQAIYRQVDWPRVGKVRLARYPARYGSAGWIGSTEAPPSVGEDNAEELIG